jgi:tetratricopeptide (TPR) repeat protein
MFAIRSLWTVCVLCCAICAAARAGAQTHDPKAAPAGDARPDLEEPEAVAKERARRLFEKGANAYRDGHFYDAVDIFLETNRLYPDPKLSFNIGKAFEGLGNEPGALRYYRDYLRRLPDAPDKKDVDAHIEQLELALSQKGLQQLSVISTPDGATLKLDGQAVGVTPWTGETFAGRHRVVLEASGYQASERVIEIELHHAQDFSFELSVLPKPALALAAPRATPHAPKVSTLTIATLAGGLALLGTALVAQAVSTGDSRGTTRTAAFFAGSGAGLSVLGGVMLYFDLTPSQGLAVSAISFDGPGLEHSR